MGKFCLLLAVAADANAFSQNLNGFGVLVRAKRQGRSCNVRGERYQPGETWSFEVASKMFNCVCKASGIPDCQWTSIDNNRRCYDRKGRKFWQLNESFTKVERGRTMDCVCKADQSDSSVLLIECTTANRCRQDGASYLQGHIWKKTDEVGNVFRCICLASAVTSCKATVEKTVTTLEVLKPVYENQVVRGGIAGFQKCDTGHRVVSAGFAWNETETISAELIIIKHCKCRNALITCENIRKSRTAAPHCLNADGVIHEVGEEWIQTHAFNDNLKWKCNCVGNADEQCVDYGTCPDPEVHENGAMLCVLASSGVKGKNFKYCRPLCKEGYDFQQRQNRAYEVCGRSTHTWSGAYAENPLLLAKCVPSVKRRGIYYYYVRPQCSSMSKRQQGRRARPFLRYLQRRGFCTHGCQLDSFRCG